MLIVPALVAEVTFDGITLLARLSAIIFLETPVITYWPSSFFTLFLVEAGCLIKLAKSGLPETPLVDNFRFVVPILLLRSLDPYKVSWPFTDSLLNHFVLAGLDLTKRFPVFIA